MQLHTVGLLLIKDKKLLLAFSNNKQAYYLPGGKIDKGESTQTALIREIAEELNIVLRPDKLKYYTHITAPAFGEDNLIMEQECFMYEDDVNPKPSGEIRDVKWFTLLEYLQEKNIAPGAAKVMELLERDEYM